MSSLIKKKCIKCGNLRKFLIGTRRDKENICGECWDWKNEPSMVLLTEKQKNRLQKLLENG